MPISREEVLHVATLARLSLSEDEIALFGEQLGDILQHIETLGELDLSDIAPTAQVIPLTNVLRDDITCQSLARDEALANAPMQEDGFIRVAPVFDEA
jgi:aspartyl-tRNA(Asn)/glutamyl-tRNA(Gln) amidotransferase subunit C